MVEELEQKVIDIFNLVLNEQIISQKDTNKKLKVLHIDSLLFIQAIVILEEELNIQIPDNMLVYSQLNTINKIVKCIKEIYL